MKRTTAAIMMVLATCPSLAAQPGSGGGDGSGRVELRRNEPPPAGRATSLDEQGVTFRHDVGGTAVETIVSWDRIKHVSGELAEQAAEHADAADRLWRARTRIERGDWQLGEPLFERLFPTYGMLTGPSSAVVAEGLLRCRLRRGAQAAAVEPWLALVRIRRVAATGTSAGGTEPKPAAASGQWIGGTIDLPPILDSTTTLAPALPPIWLPGPAVDAMTDSPGVAITGVGDDVAMQLAEWYHAAAAFESGRDVSLPEAASAHPGVVLVREVVMARIGDAAQRQSARDALLARLTQNPAPWIQVWCHAAVGRSLLREADDVVRRRGVLHLLHIPASYGAEHPYLAGVALAEAAVALDDSGDRNSAVRLRAELERSFSDHPALGWPPLRRITAPALPAPGPAGPDSPPDDPKGAA